MKLDASFELASPGEEPYEADVMADPSGVQINLQVAGGCKARINLEVQSDGRVILKAVEHTTEMTLLKGLTLYKPEAPDVANPRSQPASEG